MSFSSNKMYKQRFKEWNVFKVVRRQDVAPLIDQIHCHRQENDTSPSVINVNGCLMSSQRVKRSLRRHTRRSRYTDLDSVHSILSTIRTSQSASCDAPADSNIGLMTPDDSVNPSDESTWSDGERLSDRKHSGSNCKGAESIARRTAAFQDLATLHVAMLQTDGHLQRFRLHRNLATGRQMRFDADTDLEILFWLTKRSRRGASAIPPILTGSGDTRSLLTGSGDTRDLEYLLRISGQYHDALSSDRGAQGIASYQLCKVEVNQAQDFYARYWVGLAVGAQGNVEGALKKFREVAAQLNTAVATHHPHILPWVCFVICYDGDFATPELQDQMLKFTAATLAAYAGAHDPRVSIARLLHRSDSRRNIARVLLRQILDTFHRKCSDEDVRALKLLAELFDHVLDRVNGTDETDIEEVLRDWAKSILSLAKVIEQTDANRLCGLRPQDQDD